MAETNPQMTISCGTFSAPGKVLRRTLFVSVTTSWIIALLAIIRISAAYPNYLHSIKLWAVILVSIIFHLFFGSIAWGIKDTTFHRVESGFTRLFSKLKWLNLIIGLIILAMFFLLILGNREYSPLFKSLWVRIYLLLLTSLVAGTMLHFSFRQPFLLCWMETMLFIGIIWEILIYVPIQLGYPFSLDWSETSWYYYASFFTARRFYGIPTVWPFLDIGRPLLLSLPFLASIRSLPFERLWQALLWVGISTSLSYSLVRRLHISSKFVKGLYIAFGFVWILLGPIYYHLALAVIIVLVGYDREKPWKSLIWVMVASIWAGILRINWVPVPAMLGAALYLLETPWVDTVTWWKYLKRPIFTVLGGTIVGAGTFVGYAYFSGRVDTRVVSKFTAPFLIYRLWPNGTLSVGILPAALFLSSILVIFIWLYGRNRLIHPLRWGLVYAMLFVLFIGGVYSSLKIGGGGNLHNLDAYWMMLLIILFYALSGRVISENDSYHPVLKWPFAFLIICVPFLISMLSIPDIHSMNNPIAQQELAQLTQIVQQTDASGGKVLFIADRHLLTFGLIKDVHLVPEYELEELTEMSISGNQEYLDGFRSALAAGKYQLIVINTVNTDLQDSENAYSEENNAWRNNIVIPLLQNYQLVLTLPQSQLQVYQSFH